MTFQNIFQDREYNKKLLRLTFPIALQNLLGAMVAAADALMLGKVNQQVMAAVSDFEKGNLRLSTILASLEVK